jgi:hypothetical protein
MADATPKGPFKLVTVNTAPERAFRLVSLLTEALKERYTIVHAAIEEVLPKVEEIQPELLVSDDRPEMLAVSPVTLSSFSTVLTEAVGNSFAPPCGLRSKPRKSKQLPRKQDQESRHTRYHMVCRWKGVQMRLLNT